VRKNKTYKAQEFDWNKKQTEYGNSKISNLSYNDEIEKLESLQRQISTSHNENAPQVNLKTPVKEDLYFLNEKRSELPNDIVRLVKLNLLKNQTMNFYFRDIKKLKNQINFQLMDSRIDDGQHIIEETKMTEEKLKLEELNAEEFNSRLEEISNIFELLS
jgi:hypothetical protein